MSWFKTDEAYLIVVDRAANTPTTDLEKFLKDNDIPAHIMRVDGGKPVDVIRLTR